MMSDSEDVKINGIFAGRKISCVRWRPSARQLISQSDVFVTGSWDDQDNRLQVWQWLETDSDPLLRHTSHFRGDVNCLSYVNADLLAAASSCGDVTVYRHHAQKLDDAKHWSQLHRTKTGGSSPCTWLSVSGEEIVTVGDDGRINVLNLNSKQPVRVIDSADSCSIYRVLHVTHVHLLTANMRGQLKSWDPRAAEQTPKSAVTASQQQWPVTALARHPTQYHVVASGDADGLVCIWDMRQPRFPVSDLQSHAAAVSELQFHGSSPDSLLSAAQDGSVWLWNNGTSPTPITAPPVGASTNTEPAAGQPSRWLTLDATRRYLDVLALLPGGVLPVNSLDAVDDRLVCGGDNEKLYCISGLGL